VAISILYGGGSEGLTCFAGRGQFVFPSVVGTDRLAGIEVASAVAGESGTLGRVALPAVHVEHRGRDVTVVGEPFQLGGQAAGGDGLGLAGVAHEPHLPSRGGGDGVEDNGGVSRADL